MSAFTQSGRSESSIPRIFDRFDRARDSEEARLDSSGLGLAIVKRILDLHQSQITVASKLNTGIWFEFELRLSRQAAWCRGIRPAAACHGSPRC